MTLSAPCLRTGHFRDLTIEQTSRQELGVRKCTHECRSADLLSLLLKQKPDLEINRRVAVCLQ